MLDLQLGHTEPRKTHNVKNKNEKASFPNHRSSIALGARGHGPATADTPPHAPRSGVGPSFKLNQESAAIEGVNETIAFVSALCSVFSGYSYSGIYAAVIRAGSLWLGCWTGPAISDDWCSGARSGTAGGGTTVTLATAIGPRARQPCSCSCSCRGTVAHTCWRQKVAASCVPRVRVHVRCLVWAEPLR